MATTFRSSSVANTGAAAASTVSLSAPLGMSVGDLLLAAISTDAAPTITPPTGWILIKSVTQSSGSSSKTSVYYKLATGYETWPAPFGLGVSKLASGVIIAYYNTSGFAPITSNTATVSSAGTSLAGPGVNNSWSGICVVFWGTRNTTGSCTLTPPTGPPIWNGRADTCTTATTFIETEAQDTTAALPITFATGPTSAASQSATGQAIAVTIDDLHMTTPLCIDDVFKTAFTAFSPNTTVFVATNYPNELIIVCVALEVGTGVSVASVTATGLTFAQLGTATGQGGDCEVWFALAATQQSGVNVVVAYNTPNPTAGNVTIFGVTGVDLSSGTGSSAFGATMTGTGATGPAQVGLTTTRNNSWVFAVANSTNSNKLTIGGAGSNQTSLANHTTTSPISSSFTVMQSAATPASSTSVTMSSGSGAVTDWNMYAFEILPSLGHGLSSQGVGL